MTAESHSGPLSGKQLSTALSALRGAESSLLPGRGCGQPGGCASFLELPLPAGPSSRKGEPGGGLASARPSPAPSAQGPPLPCPSPPWEWWDGGTFRYHQCHPVSILVFCAVQAFRVKWWPLSHLPGPCPSPACGPGSFPMAQRPGGSGGGSESAVPSLPCPLGEGPCRACPSEAGQPAECGP